MEETREITREVIGRSGRERRYLYRLEKGCGVKIVRVLLLLQVGNGASSGLLSVSSSPSPAGVTGGVPYQFQPTSL